jgi:phage-related protein
MDVIGLQNATSEIQLNANEPVTIGGVVTVKSYRIASYSPRIGIQPRYGKPGGEATGDQEVGTRKLTIGLDITSENDTDYLESIETIVGFFRRENGPFYIIDYESERRARVVLDSESITTASDGLDRRHATGSLVFEMLDGLFEDQTELLVESPSGGLSNNDTLSVTNTGKFTAYPVIEIAALDTISSFTLRNTDTQVFMEIGSNDFNPGAVITIDANEGTIELDSVDASASLSDGSSFIVLQPGSNTLQFETASGSVDVSVTYRRRYSH